MIIKTIQEQDTAIKTGKDFATIAGKKNSS